MAPELPLVLRSCEFNDIKFTCSPDAQQALRHHLRKTLHDYLLQAAIFQEALDCLSDPGENDYPFRENPKKPNHVPLLARQTEREYYYC
ncbi:unnamed protein product [Spirodela intermedia]|uniref:Uncharacterized protein n=2 Tax=Spirodela intermedia TaxID=51605 RepID=A0A7I8KDM0_SPIIN|nr:unnamed protein product [Spirodela intermedia]CAA6659535.1 unnamed protein product [Spirodela intermedia]CAA7395850.1 unnamed protein product [Spirodela intermedia]